MNTVSIPIVERSPVLEAFTPDPSIPEAWLKAYPRGVMVEYTSRCNLRCKYCTKNNPGDDQIPGRDMDMDEQTLSAVMDCLKQNRFSEILLAGTGESTFHPRWTEDFPRLIAAAKVANPAAYVHLNSNFAMKYEDEHWAILALLDGIVISIDTADRQFTREVRAKSDLGLIIYNMVRFKAYCDTRGLKFPLISINVTLYQHAAAGLTELMTMLASLSVAHVAISDMVETESAKQHGVRPVNADSVPAFAAAVAHIQQAIAKAQSLGKFTLSVQPHLLERINRLVAGINRGGLAPAAADSPGEPAGRSTKLCLQPWTRFTIAADAALYPCCVTDMPAVGRLVAQADASTDGLDGQRMQRFRHELLVGQVPAICVDCSNAASGPTAQLQQHVKALAEGA